MSTLPQIGTFVHWYGNADRNMSPQAGLVISHSGDLIKLLTWDSYGVQRVRDQVRHIDDPFLKDNQFWRVTYGAWDVIDAPMSFSDSSASNVEQTTSPKAVGPGARAAKAGAV